MNYSTIKTHDTANGHGIRVSLFVSGCLHHCKGCFNPETWDFCYGKKYTEEVEESVLKACEHEYIKGLSVLGGEPFEKANQKDVCHTICKFKEKFPDKDVWCYSGWLFDVDMKPGGKVYTEWTDKILQNIDYLVDGEFIEDLKNLRLKFRGSSNQRVIDVKKSLKTGKTVVVDDADL